MKTKLRIVTSQRKLSLRRHTMADDVVGRGNASESPAVVTDDVLEGQEPGATPKHYLVTDDGFSDVEALHFRQRSRLASGTIIEIARSAEAARPGEVDEELMRVPEVRDLRLDDASPYLSSSPIEPQEAAAAAQTDDVDHEAEYVHSAEWRDKRKHVFVLSQSGKPIYSRYGNEDKLVTIFGVMQALVSFVGHSEDNVLRSIHAGGRKFVFLVREHLVLVAVAATTESVGQLQLQLYYVYNQILSVLTYSQLEKVFRQRVNYDLRRLLTGTEKFIDSLLNMIDSDPSFSLGAVRCLPLPVAQREVVSQTIVQCCKVKDLVFAIILAKNQLVSLVHMKKYCLHPQDLHLVINLVSASDSFKTAESWMPICLPKFDASGYLHAYVSYLDESCTSCLLLLTVNNEHFFQLSSCKQQIVERLNRHGCLQAIADSVARSSYGVAETGIGELRHFAYKSRSSAQYTSPDTDAPYASASQRERLYGLYLQVASRLHSVSRPLKIYYLVAEDETVLGWVTSGFELYAVFSPLVTKQAAIIAVNKLLKWIKREEDRLFILASPTF